MGSKVRDHLSNFGGGLGGVGGGLGVLGGWLGGFAGSLGVLGGGWPLCSVSFKLVKGCGE